MVWKHGTVNHSAKESVNSMARTNGIESAWACSKRDFNGVCHHFSKKYFQKHPNEFTFRLNEGNCEQEAQYRWGDLFRAMVGKSITYRELNP